MVLDHIDVALVVEAGQGILGHSANGADRVLRRDIGRLCLALGNKVAESAVRSGRHSLIDLQEECRFGVIEMGLAPRRATPYEPSRRLDRSRLGRPGSLR